eukprot:2655131-Alexandrium_andersonii.AAC.1
MAAACEMFSDSSWTNFHGAACKGQDCVATVVVPPGANANRPTRLDASTNPGKACALGAYIEGPTAKDQGQGKA